MKVPGSKIVPCQGVLGSNHSLTFGLFTQVSGSGPLGPLVCFRSEICCKTNGEEKRKDRRNKDSTTVRDTWKLYEDIHM